MVFIAVALSDDLSHCCCKNLLLNSPITATALIDIITAVATATATGLIIAATATATSKNKIKFIERQGPGKANSNPGDRPIRRKPN